MSPIRFFPDSRSQIGQESFVLSLLHEKMRGFYVEIGGFHATEISNTFLLESVYSWIGVSLEIDASRVSDYNAARGNPCIQADARSFDYAAYFQQHDFPRQIDYLQLDIEPADQTLSALLAMPTDYRYSIITFEHDLYVTESNRQHKDHAHAYLTNLGYRLIVDNMCNFEDWYVDPRVIDIPFIGSDLTVETLFDS